MIKKQIDVSTKIKLRDKINWGITYSLSCNKNHLVYEWAGTVGVLCAEFQLENEVFLPYCIISVGSMSQSSTKKLNLRLLYYYVS